jgi:hypothetical protein
MAAVPWASARPDLPWLPPSMLSLAGTPAAMRDDAAFMVRFSRAELARLCAAGLWLEALLISRVTANGFLGVRPEEARVMLQEVREESGHGLMFLEMIARAGLEGRPLLGPTRLLTVVARRLHPGAAGFWAMVFVGESVTDGFARRALRTSSEAEPICPVARAVLDLHHRDEARHIAAARALLEGRIAAMGRARRRGFGLALRFLLERFLAATLFPTPASFAALGVPAPARAAALARACPERRALAAECAAPAVELLARLGLAAPPAARQPRRGNQGVA